jgi:hypothetical protein
VAASLVLRMFLYAMPEQGIPAGLISGALLFAGFNLPLLLNTWLFEGRPRELFFINAPYQLIGCLAMGLLHGVWK